MSRNYFCAKSLTLTRCKEGDLPLLNFSYLTCMWVWMTSHLPDLGLMWWGHWPRSSELIQSSWKLSSLLSTEYFTQSQLGDKLSIYHWPQRKYQKRFCKSRSRLPNITSGNRYNMYKGRWTLQNLMNLNLMTSWICWQWIVGKSNFL